MTTPTITCEHCESEIDVAKDPCCVVYDPSGATDVICEGCREQFAIKQTDPDIKIVKAHCGAFSSGFCYSAKNPFYSGHYETLSEATAQAVLDKKKICTAGERGIKRGWRA